MVKAWLHFNGRTLLYIGMMMMTGVLWDSLCIDFVVLFYFLLKYFQVVVGQDTIVHSDVYVDEFFCAMVHFLVFFFFFDENFGYVTLF